MGKEGNYSAGAKVYESKKEKKRRLLMSKESESEEFAIAPCLEIAQTGNGEVSGTLNLVLEKGDVGEKMVSRRERVRGKLGNDGNEGNVTGDSSDRKNRGLIVDQLHDEVIKSEAADSLGRPNDKLHDEVIKSEAADSLGRPNDPTGESTKSPASLKHIHYIIGSAKESDSGSKPERKRSMEICGDEVNRKKAKAGHSDSVDDQTEKSEGDAVEHTDKDVGTVNDEVEVSKVPVSWDKDKDEEGQRKKNMHLSPSTSSKLGIRTKDKMVMGHLPSKKVDVTDDANVPCEEEGITRRLRSASTNKVSTLNNRLEKQVGKKSISKIRRRKRAGKHSSKDACKSNISKKKFEFVSPSEGSRNVELLHSESHSAIKNGKNAEGSNRSRSEAKNEIRDQIKNILLDAGWTIEFRPRKGRDYLDSVYISPKGSGYWSITKAYDMYVKHFKTAHDVIQGSEKEQNCSTGRDSDGKMAISTFAVVPPEVLLMLKKKMVNKRRSKKDLEELRGKIGMKGKRGVGRRKKLSKEVTKVKRSKDKGIRDDAGGTSSMKGKLKNSKRRGCTLLVRGSNQDEGSENGDYTPYAWKRSVLSWLIDLGLLQAYEKVSYMNKRRTRALLDGRITRDGIQCSCCSKILSVSKFEIHAGSKLRQPFENICMEVSGISLLECQIHAWEKESKQCIFYDVDTNGDDPNDDTCTICGDGGDLICCDSCPSTFHLGCLGIETLPSGDWHCTNCSCKFCRLVHESSSRDGNTPEALFTCSQCSQKYHKSCVPEGDAVSNVHNNPNNMFCGRSCKKVFRRLQKLIGVRNKLDTGFFWSIVRRFDNPTKCFSGMAQRVASNSKIAVAYAVMDECFVPIIDPRSGINLIHNVVYNCGANFNRLNFSGFYTFILERGDEIIAAASVRIHDTRMAEMPFIGTRSMYRRQGMCRRLLKGIESALRSLCINSLIIPAISELTETWTTVFGFKPLGISQMQDVKSVNMLVFPGTGLLQKPLKRVSNNRHTNPELENGTDTLVPVNADQNSSADEAIDSKESDCVAEAIQPSISILENTDKLQEASGCYTQISSFLDSAANGKSNELHNLGTCSNHVDEVISSIVSLNQEVAFIEDGKNEVKEVANAFHPSSDLLHEASRVEATDSRSPQNKSIFELPVADVLTKAFRVEVSDSRSPLNKSNFELPVADMLTNSNYEEKDLSTLGSVQNLEDKPPSNGAADNVSLEKFQFMEEDKDRADDINQVKFMNDFNGLEPNVNEESVEVIRHLSTSPNKGTYTSESIEVCGNVCGDNTKLCSLPSNESYQEETELLQNKLKCYLEVNDSAPLEQLVVSGSSKSLNVEGVTGIV